MDKGIQEVKDKFAKEPSFKDRLDLAKTALNERELSVNLSENISGTRSIVGDSVQKIGKNVKNIDRMKPSTKRTVPGTIMSKNRNNLPIIDP